MKVKVELSYDEYTTILYALNEYLANTVGWAKLSEEDGNETDYWEKQIAFVRDTINTVKNKEYVY